MFSHNLSRSPHSRLFPAVFFAADDGAGTPGGGNQNPAAVPPAATPPATNPNPQPSHSQSPGESEIEKAVERILNSQRAGGDTEAALRIAVADAERQRKRAETAEQSQLSKADRDLLSNFKGLNLSLEDIRRIVAEHEQWAGERAKSAKVESLKSAAEKAGYNADLLASLEGALDVEYSVIGEGENAKAMVKVKNGDTISDKALDEWVKEKWPALEETLKSTPNSQAGNQPQNQQRTVARYGQSAALGAANNGQGRDRVQERLDARREANKEKKNPLMA